eukprot:g552.t1
MKSKRVEVIHGEIYTGITKTVIEENEKENVHVRGEEALERIEASCEIISISARKEGGSSTYETPEQKITSLKRWEPKKRSRDAFSESENYYKARKSDEISETGIVCVQDDPESPKMRKVELYEERTNAEAHYRDAPSFPKIDFATQETVCDSSSPKGTFVKTFQPATSKGHLDLYQTEDNTFQIIKHVNKNKHFGWRLLLECRKALERNPSSYCLGARVSNHPSELLVTMPLIDGNDLLEFINARGYLSLNEALKIFRDVAEGIAHIHSLGYAHMDVALENVMIEVDSNPEQQIRRAIVIDLDFAIPLDTETGRRHAEKATNKCDGEFHPLITGRAMYMAPELINQRLRSLRESCNLRKADVYSLGVLFYTAWYCEYLSPHGDAWENVKNITTDVPHRDSPSLNELISDMVRPDPEKRPSAMEIQSRLEAMLKLGGGDENTDTPCCLVH